MREAAPEHASPRANKGRRVFYGQQFLGGDWALEARQGPIITEELLE